MKDRKQLLPLFLNLRNRNVVIFGGGSVSERKAKLFCKYACVKVVSKSFTSELKEMENRLELIYADLSRGFEEYVDGAFIVIPATNDAELNWAIEREASGRGILVNKVDGIGDVVVPSLIKKDSITIALSTENPALSKHLRIHLERELTGNYLKMAKLLGQIRPELKNSVPKQKDRAKIISRILEDEEVWRLLEVSYEKAYMRAHGHIRQDERDSLDACDPSQSFYRRD